LALVETVLLYLLGIVILLFGLAVSIGLHELGHLLPAKLFGVKVAQYMVGFGRTIVSFRRGETEYGLKMIPLGGYISMAGMYPPARAGQRGRTATTGMYEALVQDPDAREHVDSAEEEARAFYRLSVWKRVIIMLGGPFMNLVLGTLLIGIVICGHGIPVLTTTLGTVAECLVPVSEDRQDCEASDPDAPGHQAGLEPGDTILSIDGTPIATPEEASPLIRESAGVPLDFLVDRDGQQLHLTVTPALTERYVVDDAGGIVEDAAGQPITERVGFLGIGWAVEVQQQPITAVLPTVGDNIARLVTVVANLPSRVVELVTVLLSDEERDPNGLIGVVGIGRIAGEITSLNSSPVADRAASLVSLVGGLNIALLVFNLIPLPPLDGGHVLFALIDGVRRAWAKVRGKARPKSIDAAKVIPVTLAVATVLGLLTVLLVVADIVKPISILSP
jgi:membrane-associated protease RseP (regulator of RpoE activity)